MSSSQPFARQFSHNIQMLSRRLTRPRTGIARIVNLLVILSIFSTSAAPAFSVLADELQAEAAQTEETPSPTPTATAAPTETPSPSLSPTPTGPVAPTITPTLTLTPTAVVEPSLTPTPLPSITPTSTETVTSTVAPAATLAPTETVTSTAPLAATQAVTVTLSASSDTFEPGQSIILEWHIANFDSLPEDHKLSLELTAPAGFDLKGWQGGAYNVAGVSLVINPTAESGQIIWTGQDDSFGPYAFVAALSYDGSELSSTTLELEERNFFSVPTVGGQLIGTTRGFTVTVDIPDGALDSAVYVRIQSPGEHTAPPEAPSGKPFRITAIDPVTDRPVTQFKQDIEIRVSYDEATLWGHEAELVLKYYDTTMEEWRTLPTIVDTENNVVIGYSDHLTNFDIDVETWEMATLPSLDSFQVSAFTGAATYSFPIWTPPGRGGLQPSVSLSYNSQTVDGANKQTQAGIPGMGWSLSAKMGVTRSMNGTDDDLSDDTFSFTAGGVSSSLLPIDEDTDTVEFRTTDESFWRIIAHKDTVGTYQFTHWEAWDKTGNHYLFGDDADQTAWFPRFDFGEGSNCYDGKRTWFWGLQELTNVHGQILTYTYDRDSKDVEVACDAGTYNAHTAIRLKDIRYAGNSYRIRFFYQDRLDYKNSWDDDDSRVLYEGKILDYITIEYNENGGGWGLSETTIRRYELTYATVVNDHVFPWVVWGHPEPVDDGRTPTLVKIQEFDALTGGNSLPATTFTYGDDMHLTKADNGYGGIVEFTYEIWYDLNGTQRVDARGATQDISSDCASNGNDPGWDAVGGTTVDCNNDGTVAKIRGPG